jgi:hypothetical protein
LLKGDGEKRMGEEPSHTTARKLSPPSIIQYSLMETVPLKILLAILWFRTEIPTKA